MFGFVIVDQVGEIQSQVAGNKCEVHFLVFGPLAEKNRLTGRVPQSYCNRLI
jgi:hypothetical protein